MLKILAFEDFCLKLIQYSSQYGSVYVLSTSPGFQQWQGIAAHPQASQKTLHLVLSQWRKQIIYRYHILLLYNYIV